METLRQEAEKLAQERRLAREQALEWTREARMNESDEEKEKRPKKAKKAKGEPPGSGDEGEAPKKKRRGKIKKANGEATEEGEEAAAVFSDEDDAERPTKKVGYTYLRNLYFRLTLLPSAYDKEAGRER